MNILQKIVSWFSETKPILRARINRLAKRTRELDNQVEQLEKDLWKEEKFKEDYRDRLSKYYDECIELREKVKKLKRKCTRKKKLSG